METSKRLVLDSNIEVIKDLYYNKKIGSCTICKQFGVSHTEILDCLERHGCKRRNRAELGEVRRIYETDFSYFERVDTVDKAYFLGLLYADGYNHTGQNFVILKLQEQDVAILEKWKKYMQSNCPIKFIKARKSTHQNMRSVRVCNKKMSEDLVKLGCGRAKSLILQFPTLDQVPEHLIHHFVRGYFDGDGHIGISKKGLAHCYVSVCVTLEFGLKLQKLLKEKGVNCGFTHTTKIYHLMFSGRKQCLKFYRWIYKDCGELFFDRKRSKFIQIEQFSPKRKNSSSRYHGVYFLKKSNKFLAHVTHRGTKTHLGTFENEIDAAKAFNDYVIKTGIDKDLNSIPNLPESLDNERQETVSHDVTLVKL